MADSDSLPLNAAASIIMIREVARHLGSILCKKVVFLGGAVLPLLLTDPAISEVRPTRDVDVIVEVLTYSQYTLIGEQLRQNGFSEDTSPGAPVCRWQTGDILLDVMPTDETILGFSNPWYEGAMRTAKAFVLPAIAVEKDDSEEIKIRLIDSAYFLATKLEAFAGRGEKDIFGSHDLEDIITLINGGLALCDEVRVGSSEDVKQFIGRSFSELLRRDNFEDAVEGHLPADARNRVGIVMTRIKELAGLFQE